ncbi:SCO2400 family protein, partial [Streptomyces sp. CPS1]
MDYCLPCRRHLNGALVCPGCGTPADRPADPAAPVRAEGGREEPDPGKPAETESVREEPPGESIRSRSRSERRGRRAAAHRRRRRRTLLIAAGLLLAAGGLGVAELGTDAPLASFTGGGGHASATDTSAGGGASGAA